jgi:hypothetical protein
MSFNLATVKERTTRLSTDDIDFPAFASRPLSPAGLRCLRYMHDVEYHTVCYLRDLLVTSAHRDATVTAFLTFWNFEEYWHGEAIGRVLAAHGEPAHGARVQPLRQGLGPRERLAPLLHFLGSSFLGDSMVAVHMTWGALNEWTTQAGYARLAATEGHPVLTELIRRIMRQEGRHIDFYCSQARERLAVDRRAQRLVRLALQRFWKPVGAGVMPPAEMNFLVGHLFGDDQGQLAAQRIDRQISRLPGLDGLQLVSGAVARSAAAAA